MNASEVCRRAAELVSGERRAEYGEPRKNYAKLARLWSAYLGKDISPVDAAALLCLLKLCRLSESNTHLDSAVDLAGYAGIIGELSEEADK